MPAGELGYKPTLLGLKVFTPERRERKCFKQLYKPEKMPLHVLRHLHEMCAL